MNKRYVFSVGSAAIVLSLLFSFQNCSSGSLPNDLQQTSSVVTPRLDPVIPLALIIPNPSVNTGTEQTVSATYGRPPYRFTVVSGPGQINAETGHFVVGGTAGTAVIQVTDDLGATQQGTIAINVAEAPISPGAVEFNPGTQEFSVPKFNSLTIEVYGAGGGGAGLTFINAAAGVGGAGEAGQASRVSGPGVDITAGGGLGGTVGHVRYASGTGGAGGGASGGKDLNQTGTPAPASAGRVGYGGTGGTGGRAAGPAGGEGGQAPFISPSTHPQPGLAPGGGGAGASFDDVASSTDFATSGGGGGGGYAKSTFAAQSELPVGTKLQVNVGQGGVGGYFSNGIQQGRNGGAGKVIIRWQ